MPPVEAVDEVTKTEDKPKPNGLKEFGFTRREQVALHLMASLVRAYGQERDKKAIAKEAFELADAYLEVAQER